MKFDTIIIALLIFTAGIIFYAAKDYEKDGSFANTIQISMGLKEPNHDPQPEDTLVAPFAEPNIKPVTTQKERDSVELPVNKIALNKPHRSVRHVEEWLTEHIGNALMLDKEKISNLQKEVGPSFTPEAFEEYKEFGKNTNIFSAVFHGKETSLASYIKESPLFIISGPANNLYQWRFEVLMVLNLVKGKLTQYKNTLSEQQQKEVYFCITAVRNNEANRDGLLISGWKTGRCK